MKLSEAFPSDYLKATDLNGQSVIVRISAVELVELGKGREKESKLLISFLNKKKQLVCNKTNAGTIAKLYGDDTDAWVGQPITLQPREVEFQGDMVLAIRVSLQKPAATQPGPAHGILGKPAARPAPVVEAEPEEYVNPEAAAGDSEVPF